MIVSRETLLEDYAEMLLRWNSRIRLVGKAFDAAEIRREIDDCLVLRDHLRAQSVVDLGSGGGLPAIPLAIAEPERRFTLIEADARKAAFLNAARRDLALRNVAILADRLETLQPIGATEITARAFAPLPRLLRLALPHLRSGGRLLLLKGDRVECEIAEAQADFHFDHEVVPLPGHRGCVLVVGALGARA